MACYFGIQIKVKLGYDDALDAFGVHGVGGIVGGILVRFLALPRFVLALQNLLAAV